MTVTATAYSPYDSSNVATTVDLFRLDFESPCELARLTTITPTAQTSPGPDAYSGSNIDFTYNPFTVVPSWCDLTVTCESVTIGGAPGAISCIDLVDGQVTQSYDDSDYPIVQPGTYTFEYKVSTGGTDAALNPTFTFDVVLQDPCDPPTVATSTLVDQAYTISDVSQTYTLNPLITVTPSYCGLVVTATIEAPLGEKLSFASADQTFSLPQFYDSLHLAGHPTTTERSYEITVTYETFSPWKSAPTSTGSNTFDWLIKNPCVDPNYVQILPTNITDQNYIVFDEPKTFYHSDFVVQTTPVSHSLCGALTVNALYEGGPIDEDDMPLAYTSGSNEFVIDSDDVTLVGQTKTYTLEATFTNYPTSTFPTVTRQSQTKNINFNNPCEDPFSFAATPQTNPDDYSYVGALEFNLNRFTIDPPHCEIIYECQGVTRLDGITNTYIGCADLPFDGSFDGSLDASNQVSDGKMTFVASTSDYLNDVYPPGEYEITIKGTATTSGEEVFTTFVLTIVDPCNPPVSMSAPGYVDQVYTLTTVQDPYIPNDFTISPTFCPFSKTINISLLSPNTLPSAVY